MNRPNAEANLLGNLHDACSLPKLGTGAFKGGRVIEWPAKCFAVRNSSLKASMDPLPDHAALKLGKGANDLKHQLAGWRCGVNELPVDEKINPTVFEMLHSRQQIDQGAPWAIDRPGHYNVKSALAGGFEEMWDSPRSRNMTRLWRIKTIAVLCFGDKNLVVVTIVQQLGCVLRNKRSAPDTIMPRPRLGFCGRQADIRPPNRYLAVHLKVHRLKGCDKLWAISVRTLKTGAGSNYINRSRG